MTYNPFGGGFNSSYLNMATDLGDPRRQEKLPGGYATQGQAVSAPYAEANMKAAEKTNPMNAESQTPGKDFLSKYIIGGLAGPLVKGGVEDLVGGGLVGQALGIGSEALVGGLAGKMLG